MAMPDDLASRAPRLVFLFSGHMIDAPDRPTPRFPPEKEPVAAVAIASTLDSLAAGADDLGLCSGACGGDLLFAEACLARGLRLQVHIPFEEPEFLAQSVRFAGEAWVQRYTRATHHPRARLLILPREDGPLPAGEDPFVRTNLWLLETALAFGAEKVRFICLWNGQGGDGPGGTQHMHRAVRDGSGQAYVLDTTALW
jgi:hypothetical protein